MWPLFPTPVALVHGSWTAFVSKHALLTSHQIDCDTHLCLFVGLACPGYLEEEAVRTYTHLISDIDKGLVWKDTPAPKIGKQVRLVEAGHCWLNGMFACLHIDQGQLAASSSCCAPKIGKQGRAAGQPALH